MHQKAVDKAVVYAFGGRDRDKGIPVAAQHLPANTLIIGVFHGGEHLLQLRQRPVHINGRRRHQIAEFIRILRPGQTDPVCRHLQAAPELRDPAHDTDHLPLIPFAQRAGIIPDLQLHRGRPVRQLAGKIRLSRGGGAQAGLSQQKAAGKALSVFNITKMHALFSFAAGRSGELILP